MESGCFERVAPIDGRHTWHDFRVTIREGERAPLSKIVVVRTAREGEGWTWTPVPIVIAVSVDRDHPRQITVEDPGQEDGSANHECRAHAANHAFRSRLPPREGNEHRQDDYRVGLDHETGSPCDPGPGNAAPLDQNERQNHGHRNAGVDLGPNGAVVQHSRVNSQMVKQKVESTWPTMKSMPHTVDHHCGYSDMVQSMEAKVMVAA